MDCQLCDRRTIYYGTVSPCPDCSNKVKSANLDWLRNINHPKEANKVPAWITMAKQAGLLDSHSINQGTIKSANQEVPYWVRLAKQGGLY